jgi:hypothetical protein
MLSRMSKVLSTAAVAAASVAGSASACDRAVVLVQPQVFAFAPVQSAVPLSVVPLAVTPSTVTPLAVVPLGRHGVAAARVARRVAVVRPVERRGFVRSVTRVRNVVR